MVIIQSCLQSKVWRPYPLYLRALTCLKLVSIFAGGCNLQVVSRVFSVVITITSNTD